MQEGTTRVELSHSRNTIVWKVNENSQFSVVKWRRVRDEADLETQLLHMRVCSAVLCPSLPIISHISPQRTQEGLFVQCVMPYYPSTYGEMLRQQGEIEENQAKDLLIQLCSALHLANRYVTSS